MTQSNSPRLNDTQIAESVYQHFGLQGEIRALPSYIDLNRLLIVPTGEKWVIKVAHATADVQSLQFENHVMNHLAQDNQVTVSVPEVKLALDGESQVIKIQDSLGKSCFLRVIRFLPGIIWAEAKVDNSYGKNLGKVLAEVDKSLAVINHPASQRFLDWDLRYGSVMVKRHIHSITQPKVKEKIESILNEFEANTAPSLSGLPCQIIHNDANDYNLLVDTDKKTVVGLFDFGDMVETYRICELAIASAYAIMKQAKPEEIIFEMVGAYHSVYPLLGEEVDALLDLIKLRLAVSICMSSYSFSQQPENEYILVSQKDALQSIDRLLEIDPVQFKLRLKYWCRLLEKNSRVHEEIVAHRKRYLSENLSLAYKQPLKIVAGQGAYLYTEDGTRYLDMVNNVCHVGHCHPKVVTAGQKQMAKLNTNTRYLHDNIVEFSEKLLATMPNELSVCMFVNSGSEANELALRLARQYTQRKAMIVVEGGYHGNTNGCIEISPYKFDGPGGDGAPDWVKQTLTPDPFRGKFRGHTKETGAAYAADVKRVIQGFESEGQPVCAFICESIQGVGGQIIHPPGYLKKAFAHIRNAGGVCIADEVQVGMGRVGSHWWAFQTQDVIPDIITIGKPLGNGHPLAAVVTTKAIADAFVTGMEYFNTFGGNPVSCAIGSAVLDVVREEQLMQHATEVGNYLVEQLKLLQKDFPIIGDVRGQGLFIGAELIKDKSTLEPATQQIDYMIERLKDEGILLTTEGPFHNVFKIKPPLTFSKADANYFIQTLSSILTEPAASI